MRVLVTGANGLVGVNVIRELLKSGKEVTGLVRPSADMKGLQNVPCQLFRGDVLSYRDVYNALAGCDAAIHAASTTSVLPVDYAEYRKVNVDSTKNIVRAALEQGNKRLVHVSTANAFGPGPKYQPGSEASPFTLRHYRSGYINSKVMAQQYVLQEVKTNKLNAVVVNPTFVIGPFDSKPSSGKIILIALKHGIQWCPSGGKNFVHAQDVARGIARALAEGKPGECYLLAGENFTYQEFFKMLNKIVGRKRTLIKIPKGIIHVAGAIADAWGKFTHQKFAFNKSNAHLLCLDNYYTGEKARRELQITFTPVEQAIIDCLSWFKKENYVSEDNYSTHGTSFDL
jgi:dihydroflavonol-4-reductase